MSKSFLRSLRKKHDAIVRLIARNQKAVGPDATKIGELKRAKLSIKDQIARIESMTAQQEPSR